LKKRALGLDALDIDLSQFKDMLARHLGAVKSILMNQKLIAGIGNIYADEILFHARMHPATEIAGLGNTALTKLFRATRYVLEKAIATKANVDLVPKSWLLPHRGKGGKCPRCERGLKSSKIGGRAAWFCPHCQKRVG
jgi:formamidopyrimidine-DNA glycosylase